VVRGQKLKLSAALLLRAMAQEQGYIRPFAPSEEGGPFVITEVGWEDLGYQHSAEGWRRRPWWRRMLGV
jgi:hypothetical protein